tara:strand:+ start:489 stop:1397 length:909 start_codon:yes stop_codon:yes gene_type:complete
MKIFKNINEGIKFDLSIVGLGYEQRSTHVFQSENALQESCLVLGYTYHTDKFDYQKNKKYFDGCLVKEVEDDDVEAEVLSFIEEKNHGGGKVNLLLDITVLSRHRLAVVIWNCLQKLPKGSILRVAYTLSDFVPPPEVTPPVKEIGPIISHLEGMPSNVGLPTSLVVSLGYEENKALGASNYIDANEVVAFIPSGNVLKFNEEVVKSNKNFLRSVSERNRFTYDLHSPYKTYAELKSVVLSLMRESRPIILPLGPKIIAALSVVLGVELYPMLPVWRLSSKGAEEPVNRKASGHVVFFDFEI